MTNWLALIVAAISALAVGFVWYNPKVFGTAWMKEVGMTEEDAQKGNMAMIFGIALVVAFLLSFWFNYFIQAAHPDTLAEFSTFKHGAFHGSFIGVLVAMPVLVTNALFEQKSFKYMAINVGYWIVTISVMGGIISAWR